MTSGSSKKPVTKTFPVFNENENTTYQKVWDTAKAVLGGKFIAMNAYNEKAQYCILNS
jgi:hypothetical protein